MVDPKVLRKEFSRRYLSPGHLLYLKIYAALLLCSTQSLLLSTQKVEIECCSTKIIEEQKLRQPKLKS